MYGKDLVKIMEFRPCIDIHNGKVKQIVGGSLKEQSSQGSDSANTGDIISNVQENFVSEQDAVFYAEFYKNNIANINSISEIKEEKEYNLCGETISGAKLKEAICAVQDDLIDKKEKTHNEIVGYLPKVEALIAKVDNIKDIPQELLDLSEKYNYPIIMM